MEISRIIIQLIDGVSRGMIYFLLAAGLTFILGVLNVVNFAHGTFYMLGIFLSYTLISKFGFWISFLLVPVSLAIVGGVSEILLFRKVYKSGHLMQILLSFGVTYIISDAIRLLWGIRPVSVSMPSFFRGMYRMGDIILVKYNLFIILMTALFAAALFLFVYKTKIGSIVRACSYDLEMTESVGINAKQIFMLVFMTGTAMAGMAAHIAAPIVTGILGMDGSMIQIAFALVIIGGIGSIEGALIAALLIGIIEVFGVTLLPGYSDLIPFAIVIIVLTLKPSGLMGKNYS